jgi:hypothetical protein
MSRLLEIYYIVGLPSLILIGVLAALKKTWRHRLLITLVALFSVWCVALSKLETRSKRIANCPISATVDVTNILGRPDFFHAYPEGDGEWIYAVRVWPWNTGLRLSVYGNRVLAGTRMEDVGLFFRPEFPIRNAAESKQVKEFLLLNKDALVRSRE